MLQDTRPAELDAAGGADPWAEFRVSHPQERLRLLRELRDAQAPVILNGPDGSSLGTTLWTVDAEQGRLNFSAEPGAPQLTALVDADEAVAVAYLDNVKLQFEVQGLMLVRGLRSSALQCTLPAEIYRFQRRSTYRVRTPDRHGARARLRHPAIPEMALTLRVLDVSVGGCALWLPHDVPPLQAGTRIGEMQIDLDSETRFGAAVLLQHVSALGNEQGVRLGCEWIGLAQGPQRLLQRWIDRTQQRHRLLSRGS